MEAIRFCADADILLGGLGLFGGRGEYTAKIKVSSLFFNPFMQVLNFHHCCKFHICLVPGHTPNPEHMLLQQMVVSGANLLFFLTIKPSLI